MTPEEAKAWIACTERSRTAWRLDEIHRTVHDALIFKGGKMGYFVNIRRLYNDKMRPRLALNFWVVQIGTYDDAFPHIGEASFTVLGSKRFDDPGAAVKFVNDKIVKCCAGRNGVIALPTPMEDIVPGDQEDPDPSNDRFRKIHPHSDPRDD